MSVLISWKSGARVSVDANTAWDVIEENRKSNGGDIDAEALFLGQSDPDAPLHCEFVWDADEAMLRLGVSRAKQLVQSIQFVYADNEDAQPVRYYENVMVQYDEDEKPYRVYRRTEDIMADPEQRQQLLDGAFRDANAFRRRYSGLQELASVISAVDDFVNVASTG